jgi:hypothetical protein
VALCEVKPRVTGTGLAEAIESDGSGYGKFRLVATGTAFGASRGKRRREGL